MQNMVMSGIYLIISIICLMMSIVIIRKGKSKANIAFATSTSLLSLFCFIVFLDYYEIFGLQGEIAWISHSSQFIYAIGPLGMLFSSLVILNGDLYLKNKILLGSTFGYIILTILLIGEQSLVETYSVNNILMGIILTLTTYNFYKISNLSEEISKIILTLVLGLIFATFGIFLFAVFEILVLVSYLPIALLFIIVGVLIASYAFIMRADVTKA